MNLIQYRPKSFIDWDFDTLLDRFFSDSSRPGTSYPKVDVTENEDTYSIQADIPGYTEKDVDVKVDGDVLTIASSKKQEEKKTEQGYIIRERHSSDFTRSFVLPKDVDKDKIKAHFKNGVLTLDLPKTPEAKPRSIEVKPN